MKKAERQEPGGGKEDEMENGEGLKEENPSEEAERGEIKTRRQKACVYAAC